MLPFLLIGLGNPGKDYAKNRHNIGFMAVDAIADAYGFTSWAKKFQGLMCEGIIPPPAGGRLGGGHDRQGQSKLSPHPNPPPTGEGMRVILLKPSTYMNLSGESAQALARFYKIPLSNIIAIHDELDLPLGKLRVKTGGGNGGHNGLKSLDAHLGADYQRVRVGIAHPGDKDMVADYVLSDFTKAEKKTVGNMVIEIAKHIGLLLSGDAAGFMNRMTLAMPMSS